VTQDSILNPWHVTICAHCLEGITSGSEIGIVADDSSPEMQERIGKRDQVMHMDCASECYEQDYVVEYTTLP
jgi:hypothetical protein